MTPGELVAAADARFRQSAGLRRDMGAAWLRIAEAVRADCNARKLWIGWFYQRCDTARLAFLRAIVDLRHRDAEREAMEAVGL